jgi:streptogrisin C
VAASDEQPRLLFDVVGGDAYFIEEEARCSVGFSVEGGFVTAGHCALAGVSTTGFNEEPQGEFVAASFPGVDESGADDWGVVEVNADWVSQPLVNDFAGGTLPVAGAEEAPVGSVVCKYGSTTGESCGTVEALDATVNYPEGTVTGLTQTDACAEPGDSGGSWLAGDQAQGVTSGGSGDCTVGGITFFQPLNEILEVNGLTLVTTGSS